MVSIFACMFFSVEKKKFLLPNSPLVSPAQSLYFFFNVHMLRCFCKPHCHLTVFPLFPLMLCSELLFPKKNVKGKILPFLPVSTFKMNSKHLRCPVALPSSGPCVSCPLSWLSFLRRNPSCSREWMLPGEPQRGGGGGCC